MSLLVRPAVQQDAESIAEFALRLFAQHRAYDADRFADLRNKEGAARYYMSRAQADDAAVLVADMDGSVVGFAYLEYERVDYIDLLENAVWLHDLYVDDSARGKGVGKMLMQAAIEFGKRMG